MCQVKQHFFARSQFTRRYSLQIVRSRLCTKKLLSIENNHSTYREHVLCSYVRPCQSDNDCVRSCFASALTSATTEEPMWILFLRSATFIILMLE